MSVLSINLQPYYLLGEGAMRQKLPTDFKGRCVGQAEEYFIRLTIGLPPQHQKREVGFNAQPMLRSELLLRQHRCLEA